MHKKIMGIIGLIAATAITINTSWASITPTIDSQPMLIPQAPNINAKGYVLMDAQTGTIIASKNMDQKMEPASLTKLMSLYLVFEAERQGTIQLDDNVRISEKAWKTGGSKMYIEVGKKVPVKELIQGVTVQSGNDATVALAEYVAGSESSFVDLMNIEARRLGMKDTHFTDANGLPADGHYSSPSDLAILARAIYEDFPDQRHWFSEKWYTFNDIRQPNRNRLLWRFEGTTGMKTGHTDKAGYCLISSADRDDMSLISVVMGAPSDEARSDDSIRMLTYGFRFYQTKKLYDANIELTEARAWGGKKENIKLGLQQALLVTIPTGATQLKTKMQVQPHVTAPIKKGQVLGQLNISYAGEIIASQPLIALENDAQGGWWTRATDSISQTFHDYFNKEKNKTATKKPSLDTKSPTKE